MQKSTYTARSVTTSLALALGQHEDVYAAQVHLRTLPAARDQFFHIIGFRKGDTVHEALAVPEPVAKAQHAPARVQAAGVQMAAPVAAPAPAPKQAKASKPVKAAAPAFTFDPNEWS